MLGGAVGSLARYLFVTYVHARTSGPFPFGTLLVNVSGAFLIGAVMTLLAERWMGNPNLRLLLVVGFLGGYTTFSSLEYELYSAMQAGFKAVAVAYLLASIIAGYIAVLLGTWVASSKR